MILISNGSITFVNPTEEELTVFNKINQESLVIELRQSDGFSCLGYKQDSGGAGITNAPLPVLPEETMSVQISVG